MNEEGTSDMNRNYQYNVEEEGTGGDGGYN